jgi:hypothetical protein
MVTGGGITGTVAFTPPVSFRGLLVNRETGLVALQTDQNTLLTGQFIQQ